MSTATAEASTSTQEPAALTPTPTPTPNPQNATSESTPKPKPFPSITGGCLCNTIRYRLLTSPLFSYACHCPDCQRASGSAFGHFLNIETSFIHITSPVRPISIILPKRPNLTSRHVECPVCKTELWSNNSAGPAVADVRVGTLDFPSLMEPDVHAFVESKVEWVRLPEGARAVRGGFEVRKMWPRGSLRRLDVALERAEEGRGAEDGEKTPTRVEGEGEEDDEAFEKRVGETERALLVRLEVLGRKLEEEDAVRDGEEGLEEMTGKLNLRDKVEVKDGIVSEPVD